MNMIYLAAGLALVGTSTVATAAPSIAQLGGGHRILIVSAPTGSTDLATQRHALRLWQRLGEERDVAPVYLDGTKVEGVSDTAAAIRARYAVPATGFALTLVGKDGHIAWRASKPATGRQLEEVIDAMPMRRAGQR